MFSERKYDESISPLSFPSRDVFPSQRMKARFFLSMQCFAINSSGNVRIPSLGTVKSESAKVNDCLYNYIYARVLSKAVNGFSGKRRCLCFRIILDTRARLHNIHRACWCNDCISKLEAPQIVVQFPGSEIEL